MMTFSVMKVANSLGQEYHYVRSQLSNLANSDQETGISVEFSGLAYHIQSLGDFSRKEREYIKEHLYKKMEMHEKRQLERLYIVHAGLCSQSETSPFDQDNSDSRIDAMTDEEEEKEERPNLEKMTQQYFSDTGLDRAYLKNFKIPIWPQTEKVTDRQKRSVRNDVQSLVAKVRNYNFTGKSVARIFHGIASPRFDYLWGYNDDGRFWKIYYNISFDIVCEIAEEKLSSLRN